MVLKSLLDANVTNFYLYKSFARSKSKYIGGKKTCFLHHQMYKQRKKQHDMEEGEGEHFPKGWKGPLKY